MHFFGFLYQLLPSIVVYIFNKAGNLGIGTTCAYAQGSKRILEVIRQAGRPGYFAEL
jgi:hypothetical protein